jgi:hypothetical protein
LNIVSFTFLGTDDQNGISNKNAQYDDSVRIFGTTIPVDVHGIVNQKSDNSRLQSYAECGFEILELSVVKKILLVFLNNHGNPYVHFRVRYCIHK